MNSAIVRAPSRRGDEMRWARESVPLGLWPRPSTADTAARWMSDARKGT